MDQTGNSSTPLQHTSTNGVGISIMSLNDFHNINTATPAPQNLIFEFYFHLPDDTRIYRVTYSELSPSENVQLLNALHNINTATPAPQNVTFEFYFHLSDDTRIYRVTYSELSPSENVQLLNNGINLSHIPDYLLPDHYYLQSLIRQQIQQQVQHPVYQQNDIQQQSFDNSQSTSQMYSNNDTYSNETVSYNMQDTRNAGFQNSS
ncbi:unnamed protein product [Rhizophagus irregularis]|nr:unnamed protein product [Rhizophagus irregularis]